MSISTYKNLNQKNHVSDSIVKSVTTYCLVNMTNGNKTFEMWHVGLCDADFSIDKKNFKTFQCSTDIEAQQTMEYFVDEKLMVKEGEISTGNILYIFRE